jgi:thioredoxin-related protein
MYFRQLTSHVERKYRYRRVNLVSVLALPLCLLLGLVSYVPSIADNTVVSVPRATDLSQDGETARLQGLIILVEFSSENCEYCRLLESEFLEPMILNQAYRSKVIIRSLSLEDEGQVNGFAGRPVTADELVDRYNIEVTPTMVFLDADGIELSERLVGIWSIDFFGAYIDQRIDTAREKLL